MSDVIAGVLGLIGASFTLLAGVGVLRFPSAMARIHASTKATSLGFVLIVVAAEFQIRSGSTKLAMAAGLVLLTTPVAAHLVARSSHRAAGIELYIDEVDQLARAEEPDSDDET